MIKIDANSCKKCLSCVRVCPLKTLGVRDRDVVAERPENCISCGHCASVCPNAAISDEASVSRPGLMLGNDSIPSADVAERLILTRRSIRCYTARDVEKDRIERLVSLAGQAPTGGNRPKCGFVVVGRNGCEELEGMIKKYYEQRPDESIGRLVRDAGYRVLLGAPVLLGIYNVKGVGHWDAASAIQNLMLAANAMGLGTCCNGIFNGIYQNDEEIRGYFKLPEEFEMQMFIVLGYPDGDITYHHTIERVQREIIWVD